MQVGRCRVGSTMPCADTPPSLSRTAHTHIHSRSPRHGLLWPLVLLLSAKNKVWQRTRDPRRRSGRGDERPASP